MMRHAFLFFALLFQQQVYAQIGISEADRKLLDSISMQDVPARAPGIATAVVRDGEVLYQRYGGYANFADSSLISGKSRFNLASNGKQFTALAVLMLVDEGRLRLNDDLRKYFPKLYPTSKMPITVQQLLTHTSGLRDCYDLWSLQGYTWWKQSFSNADVLAMMQKQSDLNFAPGTAYLYSNTNYILLALLIDKISGTSFVAYTNEMFKLLNMPNTSFEAEASKIRGPIAKAYFSFKTWTSFNWTWNVCGDGNLFSTLEDQIQWEKSIQGKRKTGIRQELIDKSQELISGSAFQNYGYGLEFGMYKGLPYRFHEGATGAWKATLLRFPHSNLSIITLTNTGKSVPSMQSRQMADVIFNLKEDKTYFQTGPAKAGATVSEEEITGIYLTSSDFSFQFEERSGRLWLKRTGRNDVELEREADNIFHQKFDPAFKQEFNRGADGLMQVTVYHTTHAPYSLTRQVTDFSNFDFTSLTGTYRNSETGATVAIRFLKEHTYEVVMPGADTTIGLLISPNKMLVDGYSFLIESNGTKVQTFRLNGDRIRRVQFDRIDE